MPGARLVLWRVRPDALHRAVRRCGPGATRAGARRARLLTHARVPVPRLEGRRARSRHRVILVARPAAHADRAHDLAVLLQRDAAREDHDPAVVAGVDPEELV